MLRRKHINREANFNTTPELLFPGAKTGPLHIVCITSIIRVLFSLMGYTSYFLVCVFFTVMPFFVTSAKKPLPVLVLMKILVGFWLKNKLFLACRSVYSVCPSCCAGALQEEAPQPLLCEAWGRRNFNRIVSSVQANEILFSRLIWGVFLLTLFFCLCSGVLT